MSWNPEIYRQTITFVGRAHASQKVPGTEIPYIMHLASVAMETASAIVNSPSQNLDIDFAIQCALLHDILEDTKTHYDDVVLSFGSKVAEGVLALTKNDQLPSSEQMPDSLRRILAQPLEVRIVKMADRVDNLYFPALYWTSMKRKYYQQEAQLILDTLGGVNEYIESRLRFKIENYNHYL
jgi:guanosine-3',5'-bis(diphosphate) 3'-pyrophosphohydrolase